MTQDLDSMISFINTSLTGVRNAKEAYENTAATSWSLTPEEIAIINKAVDALDQEEN